MPPIWTIIGDFNVILNYGSDVPLNREVTFENTATDLIIEKFELCGYRDGAFQLIATAKDSETYTLLKNAITQAGFPAPYFLHQNRKIVCLQTSNLGQIKNFILALDAVEPHFTEIKQEICNAVGVDLNLEYDEISLEALTTELIQEIQVTQFPLNNIFITLNQILGDNNSNTIQSVVDDSEEEGDADEDNDATNEIPQTVIDESFELATTYSIRGAPAVPSSENETKLEALRVSRDEIPEKYICALSSLVMTIPVYDPLTPDTKFDKAQILHWFYTKETNPFTGTPLSEDKLVEDKELEREIACFIHDKEIKSSNEDEDEDESPRKRQKLA